MAWSKAFNAGVIAGLIMFFVLLLAQAAGIPARLALLLGTMFGLEPGTPAWLIGIAIHLIVSGMIAWAYAAGFEYVLHRANAWWGIAFSGIHAVIGGLAMGLIPLVHPLVPERISAPGVFLSNYGTGGVLFFIAAHVVYGALVGALYSPVRHRTAKSVSQDTGIPLSGIDHRQYG